MTDDIKALVAELRGQSERVRAAIEVAGLAWDGDDLPSRAAGTIEALEAELVKLHGLRDQWQEIVFAPDFIAAAEAAARQYHDGECIYQQERDHLKTQKDILWQGLNEAKKHIARVEQERDDARTANADLLNRINELAEERDALEAADEARRVE